MHHDNEEVRLTPVARRFELASIFAAGILRLHVRGALIASSEGDPPAENLPKSGSVRLEVPAETVLSVTTG